MKRVKNYTSSTKKDIGKKWLKIGVRKGYYGRQAPTG